MIKGQGKLMLHSVPVRVQSSGTRGEGVHVVVGLQYRVGEDDAFVQVLWVWEGQYLSPKSVVGVSNND